jgi:hypothetical protein
MGPERSDNPSPCLGKVYCRLLTQPARLYRQCIFFHVPCVRSTMTTIKEELLSTVPEGEMNALEGCHAEKFPLL